MSEKWPVNFACDSDLFLHAENLGHGTDGFTSPPKEGMLWIFLLGLAWFEPAIFGTRGKHANH
jgi:hypothetical protein